jgi:hypothetical protein
MHGALRWLALVIGVFGLFVWSYGGYYAADIALEDTHHRWLFFLGLVALLLYIPLYAYRRWEDARAAAYALPTPAVVED